MSALKPQDVLKMLREARKMPKSSNITNICGKPAPVSGVAALPTLYELEHGPAPTRATTLPVRTAPTTGPAKVTSAPTKATVTKPTTANTASTPGKAPVKKAAAKKTVATNAQNTNTGN